MSAKPVDKVVSDAILLDWRMGRMSQRDIADKRKVSLGTVNKICKGVDQDVAPIVNAGIQFKQALNNAAVHDERMVNAVTETIDEVFKIKKFFQSGNLLVANTIVAKVKREGQNATFKDLAAAASGLGRAQESVLGKTPETVVNVGQSVNVAVNNHTPEQLRKINEDLENAC